MMASPVVDLNAIAAAASLMLSRSATSEAVESFVLSELECAGVTGHLAETYQKVILHQAHQLQKIQPATTCPVALSPTAATAGILPTNPGIALVPAFHGLPTISEPMSPAIPFVPQATYSPSQLPFPMCNNNTKNQSFPIGFLPSPTVQNNGASIPQPIPSIPTPPSNIPLPNIHNSNHHLLSHDKFQPLSHTKQPPPREDSDSGSSDSSMATTKATGGSSSVIETADLEYRHPRPCIYVKDADSVSDSITMDSALLEQTEEEPDPTTPTVAVAVSFEEATASTCMSSAQYKEQRQQQTRSSNPKRQPRKNAPRAARAKRPRL